MSVVDDPQTLGRARLTFANEAEIDEFVSTLERYERGELSPDGWRAYRLVRGTYGQRQAEDAQMLRVKIPQGLLTTNQLVALAEVGERYSRGFGHITTRQNVQFHFVKLHDVEPALRRLAEDGLTTREACGNSVRNITGCPYAGVSADEVFDVTPYAEAMTRFLLRHRLSSTLPRKFKIAFEGCSVDHIATPINDLGFRAVRAPGGGRGFRVTVAGGTAILVRTGALLHEFIPTSEIFRVAEAVLSVFHRLGDYKHKQRNRIKFLVRELGWTRFREEYDRELSRARLWGRAPTLEIDPENEQKPDWPLDAPPDIPAIAARVGSQPLKGPGLIPTVTPLLQVVGDQYAKWRETNVRPQKQFGFNTAVVSVPLGDLTTNQMRVLAELSRSYSDGTVRVTMDQDLVLRWVAAANVRPLYRRLAAAGLGLAGAETLVDVASCPGAESCRLAVTQSRGLGRLLEDHLRARPDLVAAADGARIKISGCPNGCGQHHIATFGFQGSVRRIGARAVPQYFVMVGGGAMGDEATFARLAAKIPARRIPDAIERLIAMYTREHRPDESAPEFFVRVDLARVKAALTDLEQLSQDDSAPADFVDLGEVSEFNPLVMDGECSA
jgi:sulfite reductase beta subunit-like hemoprotein